MGALNFGFTIGFTSPLVPFFSSYWGTPEIQTTFFNAILSLLAIIGPYIATFMLKYLGRRPVFCILQFVSGVIYLLMITANKNRFWILILMRALMGLAIGGVSSTTPTMLVEVAPEGLSGFFGNLTQTGVCLGSIIVYLVGNWTANVSKEAYVWYVIPIVTASFDFLSCCLIWLCPETGNQTPNDNKVEEEGEKERLCQKKYLGKLFVGIMLMIIQQFCGINAIVTNLDENLRTAKVPMDSGIASAVSMFMMIVGVFIGGFVIDKMGRKPLFTISCLGCRVTLIIYACCYNFDWPSWIALICICLYLFFFGFALGPVPWYCIPELFPPSLRSLGNSIISTTNQLFTFVVIFLFPVMRGKKEKVQESSQEVWDTCQHAYCLQHSPS
ncbi:major facilitator superfamily protein [Trichomonas vaginalis G3]|uniref:Major facilitator superfamily protein n=1 Tax=Trichomonas vaginalis (strain ATCC PRA-98 / G3) TaxID=412133 RepID=A2DXY5_TRIV3|nr:major facilitator superfamily transporter [Trichomonas vaginalis G3]EAY14721.1 major facilitator superfamily protein [Trichomonas vaginalis G3]KAI5487908.1 glucose import [Trichomonas vaginalis G3]|eukprot:XP_001326944.1 major facilitator superfamily transporter [Trichomonas vaginalis G3]